MDETGVKTMLRVQRLLIYRSSHDEQLRRESVMQSLNPCLEATV